MAQRGRRTGRKVNPVRQVEKGSAHSDRWRHGERREDEEEDERRSGQSGEGGERRDKRGEQRGLEALFVGTVSRNSSSSSSSSSPFDLLSPRGPASLYGAKTQVSVPHSHTFLSHMLTLQPELK